MPGKLDKFFASKDKKKAPKKEEKKDDDDNVALANEAGLDFGITGEFTGRTVKLTKEGAIETNEEFGEKIVDEPIKTWKGKDEAAKEAEEAAKELAEKKAKEAEESKPKPGVYVPGQGSRPRPKANEPVEIGDEAFPTLGDATKFKSADDYQKSLKKEDEKKPSSNAFKARATPSNAWSSQTSLASQMGPGPSPGAYRPPASSGGAYQAPGSGGAYKPPGSGGAYQAPGSGGFGGGSGGGSGGGAFSDSWR
jgi:hypothetical protein